MPIVRLTIHSNSRGAMDVTANVTRMEVGDSFVSCKIKGERKERLTLERHTSSGIANIDQCIREGVRMVGSRRRIEEVKAEVEEYNRNRSPW